MVEVSKLKAQLVMMFRMKDPRATKQILDIEVHRDEKNGKLWLSRVYTEEVQCEHCETNKYPFSFPL
jgi:hypothetical protein